MNIIDNRYAPHGSANGPAGVVVCWHVDTEHEAPVDREAGFITASVVDPLGNILEIMYNPHYLEVLSKRRPKP